jgi:mRNA-degrading endonuclease toxin of MazEF toxin-antitoxin module
MTDAINLRLPHNWKPRDCQRPLWDYLEQGGKRACVVWHRRSGKDSVAVTTAVPFFHTKRSTKFSISRTSPTCGRPSWRLTRNISTPRL